MKIKCITINTHGLREAKKRSKVLQWLKNSSPDVPFLQESHLLEIDKTCLQKEWEGLVFLSPGEQHSAGVVTLLSRRLNAKVISTSSDPSGRYLLVIIEVEDKRIQFCNIYAPNQVSARKNFFQNLSSVMKRGLPTIFGGDFNCNEDYFLDKIGGDKDLAISALQALQQFNTTFQLKDVFRHLNPSAQVFTWSSANGSVSCRLDRFYVSEDISCNCSSS